MPIRVALILALFLPLSMVLLAQNQTVPVQSPQQPVQAPPQQIGQQTGQQAPQRPIPSITNLVIVPVVVKDSAGQLVSGLARTDFRILKDNEEQRIVGFSAEALPLSAVVVMDNDLSDKQQKQVQQSLETISAAFGPGDEVALVTYDQFPQTVSNFTTDNDSLFTALKRVQLGSHSTFVYPDPETAGPINPNPNDPTSAVRVKGPPKYQNTSFLDDAVFAAGQMLTDRERDRCVAEAKKDSDQRCRTVRKMIFLITDGSDARNERHPYDETLATLIQHDVAVFSISVSHSVPFGKSIVQHGQSELGNYATKTGGDSFFAAKQSDLDRMYANLTEEARNTYTLSFDPGQNKTGKDYHTVEVRVENHGTNLNILTRDGFYYSSLADTH